MRRSRRRRTTTGAVGIVVALSLAGYLGTGLISTTSPRQQPSLSAPAVTATSAPVMAATPGTSATQVVGAVRPFPVVLYFSDTAHGLLIGPGCARSNCLKSTEVTADGGHTWTRGGDLPRGSKFDYAVNIFAADRRNLFLSQRDADYSSHDGGLHWNRLPVPPGIHFVGIAGSVWLSGAASCGSARSPACTVSLSSMSAAGGPLSPRPAPPTQGQPVTSIQRVGRTLILEAGQSEGGRTVLLASTDEGYHWMARSNPCGRMAVRVSAGTDGALWALCAGVYGTGMAVKKLFVSADSAEHWSARPDPEAGGYSTNVHPISATVAWRTGYFGSARSDLFSSQDSGRTWADPLAGRIGENGGGGPYLFADPTGKDAWVAALRLRCQGQRLRRSGPSGDPRRRPYLAASTAANRTMTAVWPVLAGAHKGRYATRQRPGYCRAVSGRGSPILRLILVAVAATACQSSTTAVSSHRPAPSQPATPEGRQTLPPAPPSPDASPTVTGAPRIVGLAVDPAIMALARANCTGMITAIVNNTAPIGHVIAQRTTGDYCEATLTLSAGPRASAARCSTLTITAGQVGVGLGHSGFVLNLRNSGHLPCTLNAYPTVTATESGTRRTITGTDSPGGYLGGTDLSVPTLLLRPGDAVSALIEGTNNPVGNATSCLDLTKLRVTVNGRTTSVQPTLTNCSGLEVHPYLPGTTGTAR